MPPAPTRGATWAATIAHRRAVDRVRSAQAASDREHAQAAREHTTAFDEIAEQVETLRVFSGASPG